MSRRARRQAFWQQELLNYAEGVHRLNPPATEKALASTEQRLGRTLDPEHRAFLEQANGASFFHDAYLLSACEELDGDEIGLEGEAPLARDPTGRVLRLEESTGEMWVVGSSFNRWLDGIFAREGLVHDRDGEFLDVFDEDAAGTALRADVLQAREERTLRHDPDSPAAHFELGRLLARGGSKSSGARARAAEKAFASALQLEPRFSWAAFELGRLLVGAGRPKEAAVAFEQAGVAAAGRGQEHSPNCFAWATLAALRAQNPAAAAKFRARVRLSDPGFAKRQVEVARRRRGAETRELVELALAVEPELAEAKKMLARLDSQTR